MVVPKRGVRGLRIHFRKDCRELALPTRGRRAPVEARMICIMMPLSVATIAMRAHEARREPGETLKTSASGALD